MILFSMYKALPSLLNSFLFVFTFNHHSRIWGNIAIPREFGWQRWKQGTRIDRKAEILLLWLDCSAKTCHTRIICCQKILLPALRKNKLPKPLVTLFTLCICTVICNSGAGLSSHLSQSRRIYWKLYSFTSTLLQIVLWPLCHLSMQTFTAGNNTE